MPKINIHSGVVMAPSRWIASEKSVGSAAPKPVMYRVMPTARPSIAGLQNAKRREMYFLSPQRQKMPRVKARMFMDKV